MKNKPGELLSVTSKLKQNNASSLSVALSNSSEFGILRLLTKNYKKVIKILQKANFSVKLSEVIGAKLHNNIDTFKQVVKTLSDAHTKILCTYTVSEKNEGFFIFMIDNTNLEKSCALLINNRVILTRHDDLT